MKLCRKCGIEKEEGRFARHYQRRDGLQDHCRECQRAYKLSRQASGKPRMSLEDRKRRREAIRDDFLAGMSARDVAAKHGVTVGTASQYAMSMGVRVNRLNRNTSYSPDGRATEVVEREIEAALHEKRSNAEIRDTVAGATQTLITRVRVRLGIPKHTRLQRELVVEARRALAGVAKGKGGCDIPGIYFAILRDLINTDASYTTIGVKFGLSRERIRQLAVSAVAAGWPVRDRMAMNWLETPEIVREVMEPEQSERMREWERLRADRTSSCGAD